MQTIHDILRYFYGLTAPCATETEGGWSAAAYRVEASQGRFFLKVYDRSMPSIRQWTDRIGSYLPVLIYLNEKTPLKGRVVRPVPAPDGEYVYTDEERICLLFDFIDGKTIGERGFTHTETLELARIMAILHGYGTEIPVDTSGLMEDISLSFCTNLQKYLMEPDAFPEVMDGAMEPHREILLRLCEETFALRDAVRAPCRKLSLCHTDMHIFNVMKTDRLIVLDWEGLRLAPPEADLFMLTTAFVNNPFWDDFLDAYMNARPGFALDRDMLRFYILRRQAEDIWDSLARLLYDNPDEETTRDTRRMIMQVIRETEPLMR